MHRASLWLFPFRVKAEWNEEGLLTKLDLELSFEFLREKRVKASSSFALELASELSQSLRKYFVEKKNFLDVPHALSLSNFKKRVLKKLREVKRGRVITYKELAESCGLNRGFQAIGQALKANPLPLVYPCHRVVSVKGLGGFSKGTLLKWLLLFWERNSNF